MVANLKEGMKIKCEQYWPEQGHNMRLGPYMVTTVEEQCFPYHITRKILLKVSKILWMGLLILVSHNKR
jgi:protein tyrosine phosphatase